MRRSSPPYLNRRKPNNSPTTKAASVRRRAPNSAWPDAVPGLFFRAKQGLTTRPLDDTGKDPSVPSVVDLHVAFVERSQGPVLAPLGPGHRLPARAESRRSEQLGRAEGRYRSLHLRNALQKDEALTLQLWLTPWRATESGASTVKR